MSWVFRIRFNSFGQVEAGVVWVQCWLRGRVPVGLRLFSGLLCSD